MVVSSTKSPEDGVVVYRKPAAGIQGYQGPSNNELTDFRSDFDRRFCWCSGETCLMAWATLILMAAAVCFSDLVYIFVFTRDHFQSEGAVAVSAYLYGVGRLLGITIFLTTLLVAASGALLMTAASLRSYILLKISFYYMIGVIGFFIVKDLGLAIFIFLEEYSSWPFRAEWYPSLATPWSSCSSNVSMDRRKHLLEMTSISSIFGLQ